MTLHSQSWLRDNEMQFIESLRTRYEDKGFTFTANPDSSQLPIFLESYIPDAIAQKPGQNVAIEVKQRQNSSTERALTSIRRLFDGHTDWQFQVVYMGTDPLQLVTIPVAQPAAVRRRMNEVHALSAQGHCRSALIMAWSLLEAALRSLDGEKTSRPLTPGTIVQTIAANGFIEPDTERHLRALIDLRNRIVHGDLAVEPTAEDIELMLSATEKTLNAEVS